MLQTLGVPFFGAQLPLVQGTSFAAVSTMLAIIGDRGGEGLQAIATADRTNEYEQRDSGRVKGIGNQEKKEAPASEHETEGTGSKDRAAQISANMIIGGDGASSQIPRCSAHPDDHRQGQRRHEADGPRFAVGGYDREKQDVEEHERVHERNLPRQARILLA